MRYELILEGSSGTIKLASLGDSDDVITKTDFLVSQVSLETNDKSDSLFNTLVIEGEIKDKTQHETKELLDWSLKTAKAEAYKNVTLIVKKNADVIRDYYLKDMYCVSYQEIFNEEQTSNGKDTYGRFILKMRQRKGAIETIKVDC